MIRTKDKTANDFSKRLVDVQKMHLTKQKIKFSVKGLFCKCELITKHKKT